jgi:hypothetical protein
MGDPTVDTPRLGSSVLTLSELDGPRVEVATHDRRWSIARARQLAVTVVDGRGVALLVDTNRRTQVDINASHDDLKVAIALWAADQTRAVWSFWRHIVNAI